MFTYGDNIIIKKSAPEMYRPGDLGSICGIVYINNHVLSDYYKLNIGVTTYTVEFVDGSDMQIPEEYLEYGYE